MSNALLHLTANERDNATFHLLSCSTLGRYAEVAVRLGSGSKFASVAFSDPQVLRSLIVNARELWSILLNSDQRDLPEVELALMLSVLARTARPELDDLLRLMATVERPGTRWISALCRHLLEIRASNSELTATARVGRQAAIRIRSNASVSDHTRPVAYGSAVSSSSFGVLAA